MLAEAEAGFEYPEESPSHKVAEYYIRIDIYKSTEYITLYHCLNREGHDPVIQAAPSYLLFIPLRD